MHYILILYACAAFLAVQLVGFIYRMLSSPLRDVPGPWLARFTKLWYFRQVQKGGFETINIALHQRYGPVVRVAPNMYSIAKPDKTLYGISSKSPKSEWYQGFSHPDPSQFTLFSDRNIHRHRDNRKKFQHLYSMSNLVTYEAYVDKCNDIFSERLAEFSESGRTFDLGHWLICYAFDVIGEITYSQRFGFLDSGSDVGGMLYALQNNLVYATLVGIVVRVHPYLYKILQYLPNTGAHGRQYLRGVAGKRIMERNKEREAHQNGGPEAKKGGNDEEHGPKDFLDKISDARDETPEKITPYDIFLMTMSNIIAGSDTTGVTLSSIFYHLLRNPEVMKKLRQELDRAVADGRADDKYITFAESQKLPYLQAVLKESMRMHAAVGLPLWRDVVDGGAEICGRFFPAGSTVGYNSWVGHYDETVFGLDAAEFRPERWIEAEADGDEKLKLMETYYSPFGLGSRVCLGKHISILEMSKVVPRLIRCFDFELQHPEKKWATSNFWFVKPVDFNVKVSKRAEFE